MSIKISRSFIKIILRNIFLVNNATLPSDNPSRFQKNSPLSKEFKKKKLTLHKRVLKKYNRSDLICNSKFSFYKYHDINEFNGHSSESKFAFLDSFYQNFNKSNSEKSRDKHTKKIKNIVCNKASEFYKGFLRSYFVKYKNFLSSKTLSLKSNYDPKNFFLGNNDYGGWYEKDNKKKNLLMQSEKK